MLQRNQKQAVEVEFWKRRVFAQVKRRANISKQSICANYERRIRYLPIFGLCIYLSIQNEWREIKLNSVTVLSGVGFQIKDSTTVTTTERAGRAQQTNSRLALATANEISAQ